MNPSIFKIPLKRVTSNIRYLWPQINLYSTIRHYNSKILKNSNALESSFAFITITWLSKKKKIVRNHQQHPSTNIHHENTQLTLPSTCKLDRHKFVTDGGGPTATITQPPTMEPTPMESSTISAPRVPHGALTTAKDSPPWKCTRVPATGVSIIGTMQFRDSYRRPSRGSRG